MDIGKTLYAKDRRAWRAWLKKHHATAPEIWLVYYKKGSGRPRIPYNDAVEEALCFGWIDSIANRSTRSATRSASVPAGPGACSRR